MHEVKLLQGAIDRFLPHPARLSCTVHKARRNGVTCTPVYRPHVACERKSPPPLARGQNATQMSCDTQDASSRLSIQSPLWRPTFLPLSAVASSLGCRRASPSNAAISMATERYRSFIASVFVQPLCTDELPPDSLTLRNLVEDMMVHHFLHLSLAALQHLATGDLNASLAVVHLALRDQASSRFQESSSCSS